MGDEIAGVQEMRRAREQEILELMGCVGLCFWAALIKLSTCLQTVDDGDGDDDDERWKDAVT